MFDSLSVFCASIVCLLVCIGLATTLGILLDLARSILAAPEQHKVHIHRAIRDTQS
jgi:hypothetical protein